VSDNNRGIIERDAASAARGKTPHLSTGTAALSYVLYPPVSRNLFARLREIARRQEFPEFAARARARLAHSAFVAAVCIPLCIPFLK